jgi:hypothetical protein
MTFKGRRQNAFDCIVSIRYYSNINPRIAKVIVSLKSNHQIMSKTIY